VRSGDDRQVCLRLLQRLASARRAIIGIYFPPIPWPMTDMLFNIPFVADWLKLDNARLITITYVKIINAWITITKSVTKY